MDVQCCASHHFACFGRVGRLYAQCRPVHQLADDATGECRDTAEWLCPRWEPPPPSPPPPPPSRPPPPAPRPPYSTPDACVKPYHSCWNGVEGLMYGPAWAPLGCCAPDEQGRLFTCQRRAGGRQYAQCRLLQSDGICVPDTGWDCAPSPPPATPSLPPPPSPPPPPRPPHPAQVACAGNYENCWGESGVLRCCEPSRDGMLFGCYRKPGGRRFAMCRPLPAGATCISSAQWQCPESPPPAPPGASLLPSTLSTRHASSAPGRTGPHPVAASALQRVAVIGVADGNTPTSGLPNQSPSRVVSVLLLGLAIMIALMLLIGRKHQRQRRLQGLGAPRVPRTAAALPLIAAVRGRVHGCRDALSRLLARHRGSRPSKVPVTPPADAHDDLTPRGVTEEVLLAEAECMGPRLAHSAEYSEGAHAKGNLPLLRSPPQPGLGYSRSSPGREQHLEDDDDDGIQL